MSGPLKPSEVQKKKNSTIPEVVFKVFNALIVENWSESSQSATVTQDEAVTRISKALKITRQEAFNKHYLDVEDAYSKAGWDVNYDKPGYCETYEAYFVFSKK